jgi:hypothetical protein
MRSLLTGFCLIISGAANAQEIRDREMPERGAPAVVSVGDTVYEHSRLSVVPAYEVLEGFDRKNVFARVIVTPGMKFIRIDSKSKLKACTAASLEAFVQKLYSACLYDDDLNGTFDRFGANEIQGGKKLTPPIAYRAAEFVQPTNDSVKQIVIFLGSTKDSVRFSYREFINDMARPAFTEEYTFPLAESYPQTIAFKGVKLSVSAIDGEGIHYSLK